MPGAIVKASGVAGAASFGTVAGAPTDNAALVQYVEQRIAAAPSAGIPSIAAAPDKDSVDLSGNTSIAAIAAMAAAKLAPSGVKTINGQSLIGTGNVTLTAAAASGPVQVAYSASIPLDGTKYSADHQMTAAETLSVAAGAIEGGSWYGRILGDGTHPLSFAAGIEVYGTFQATHANDVTMTRQGGRTKVVVIDTGIVLDTTAPLLGTPHVETGAPNVIVVPVTETGSWTVTGSPSGVTLASAGGRTVTAIAKAGSDLQITLSSGLAYGDAPTVALAAGMVTDAAGNASAAKPATPVTNNVVGAPTITAQPSSQSVTAPASATFTVAAQTNGGGALTYQWRRGGAAISGATSASYTTAATTTGDSGASFEVAVTNSVGSVTSSAATLTVAAAAPAPAPAPSPSPAPALRVLIEDSFTQFNSGRTDGPGSAGLDQHLPDITNADGGRWSGYQYDYMDGNGARVTHWFNDRLIYNFSERPKKTEHVLSFDPSIEAGVTLRDNGDRSTSYFYFLSLKVDSISLYKLNNDGGTQLWTAASTAFAAGASAALTIFDDASGNCTIQVNGVAVGTPVVLDAFAANKAISIGASGAAAHWTRCRVSA